MRTFVLVCVVALVVAGGVAYAVGLVVVSADHAEDKYIVSVTVDTGMLHRTIGTHETESAAEANQRHLQELHGTIVAVRSERNEFSMSDSALKNWTFRLARDAKIIVNGRDGSLSALLPGDEATVEYNHQGEDLIASTVRCTRK